MQQLSKSALTTAPSRTTQFDAWSRRTLPDMEWFSPSLVSFAVPCPFPVKFTYVYVALGDDGSALVIDPGYDSHDNWKAMEAGLRACAVPLDSIAGIVVTHHHPDHLGAARRLSEASGGWIGMTVKEQTWIETVRGMNPTEVEEADRNWLKQYGVPRSVAKLLYFRSDDVADPAQLSTPDRELADGEWLDLPGRKLQVVTTPGHTSGHICIVDADNRKVIAGDHFLPVTAPNVSARPEEARDPLDEALISLARMRQWADHEILPAHEYCFDDVDGRVARLSEHHMRRNREFAAQVDMSPRNLWQLAQSVTWSSGGWELLSPIHQRAALGTALAHMIYLENLGTARRVNDKAGCESWARVL